MSQELVNKRVEEKLRMPAGELKDTLPLTLDEIRQYGISKMLEEAPDLLSKIMGKMMETDAAKLVSDVPEVGDKLMNILWEGLGVLAVQSEEMRAVLGNTREMKVNLEASDSPSKAHFTISQGKLSGGSGLVPFKEQDFRFFGPTGVLMRLLSGKLSLGFSDLKLQTEGHPGFFPWLTPIMQGIAKLIKGK